MKESTIHGLDNSWCSVKLWQAYSAFFRVVGFLCFLVTTVGAASWSFFLFFYLWRFQSKKNIWRCLGCRGHHFFGLLLFGPHLWTERRIRSLHRSRGRGCSDCVTRGRGGTANGSRTADGSFLSYS